jgi:hypothetical protein
MIKVFLLVVACMRPDFTTCQQLMAEEITGPDPVYWCLLNRPFAAMLWQERMNDGWLTFTRCQLVNTEKNGRLG